MLPGMSGHEREITCEADGRWMELGVVTLTKGQRGSDDLTGIQLVYLL